MLAPTISASKAKTFLLTGKSFFQTEPEVLRKWLWLSRSGRVEAKLHFQKGITFHPKVFLVDGKRPFAIVGLGNLSRGGLHGNVECAIFVDSSTVLRELRAWFDTIFSSNATAVPLTEALILDYERKYKALRKPITELRKQQQQFERNSAWNLVASSASRGFNRWGCRSFMNGSGIGISDQQMDGDSPFPTALASCSTCLIHCDCLFPTRE